MWLKKFAAKGYRITGKVMLAARGCESQLIRARRAKQPSPGAEAPGKRRTKQGAPPGRYLAGTSKLPPPEPAIPSWRKEQKDKRIRSQIPYAPARDLPRLPLGPTQYRKPQDWSRFLGLTWHGGNPHDNHRSASEWQRPTDNSLSTVLSRSHQKTTRYNQLKENSNQ